MGTYVLIHGAGSDEWYWHLVLPELRARVGPVPGRFHRSDGVYRVPVDLLVLVAAMVPLPGESAGDWWANTNHEQAQREQAEREGRNPDDDDEVTLFLHDLPTELVAEAMTRGGRAQSGTPFGQPWPLEAWPDVTTRFLLCRHDRLFPAAFMRRVVRERLGIVPDEMDGGHLPALARPKELAERLEAYRPGR